MQECPACREPLPPETDRCLACGWIRTPVPCARHPDRPAGGRCVVCGAPVCDRCDRRAGPAHRCPDHATVPVLEGWAQVYVTTSEPEAGLLCDNLRAEGVDCRVLSQADHFAFAVRLGDLAPVRVLVPAYAYEDAARILRAHQDERGTVLFGCPRCGTPFEPGEGERCSACGAPLPRVHGAGAGHGEQPGRAPSPGHDA